MAKPLSESNKSSLLRDQKKIDSTIDNGATYTQLSFLARVYTAQQQERHRESFLKGLDYLLKAQYPMEDGRSSIRICRLLQTHHIQR